ncbi:MAG: peptide ABC transporter substrate-binding protein [Kiritimatiellae bacterium]|nr:peptide ABC transporter substrate-binding protein [Kiritimatiellia bacterium]
MLQRFILVLALVVTGCGRKETPADAGIRDQVLHFGNSSEPQDLDPHVVTGVTEHNILVALLEGLVSEDPVTLAPLPGVASSWELSEDGTVYTFHLREDARWSNDDPVTAEDFVFSYKRMLNREMGSPYGDMLYCLNGAEAYHKDKNQTTDFKNVGVRAADPHTLVLTLGSPTPHFLSLLNHFAWFPVHPGTIRAFKAETTIATGWTRPPNFVGNGPFVLTRWSSNDRIVVEKSSTYWDRENVRLNAIHFHAIGDHNAEERAFRSGQLHVTGTVPIDRLAFYAKHNPDVLRIDPYLGCYYYLINVNIEPLTDPRVRRALSMSIDREKLVRYVTKGGEDPAFHFTPPNTAGYTADAGVRFDPAGARALLADAGYPEGQGLPPIPLLYNTSDAHATVAQAVGRMWEKTLGITIELQNMEWKVYLNKTQTKQYSLARAGWIADFEDPSTFLGLWVTDAGNNRAGWSNAAYDALIRDSALTVDPEKRNAIFKKAEAILMEESPIIPLYFYRSKTLLHRAVREWHPTLLDHHPYKYVYLEAPDS